MPRARTHHQLASGNPRLTRIRLPPAQKAEPSCSTPPHEGPFPGAWRRIAPPHRTYRFFAFAAFAVSARIFSTRST